MCFLITKHTKAIYLHDTGYYRAKILDGEDELCSIETPTKIISENCISNGSTLEGREKAVKQILKTKSKLPVPVVPAKGIYMFPTLSKRNEHCIWLSYYQIDNYKQIDNRTLIQFKDGTGIYAKISEPVVDLQFKRTSQVIAQLNRPTIFGPHSPDDDNFTPPII